MKSNKPITLARIFVTSVFLVPSAGNAGELLKLTYEDGRISLPMMGVTAVLPQAKDAIQISKEFARSGKSSLRTKVDRADQYISEGKHRAESDAIKNLRAHYKPGDKRRYQFSVMLDKDWQVSKTAAVDIIWQFKRANGFPDMFVGVKRDAIVLRHGAFQDVLVNAYKPGEWMDFRLNITWSTGATGLIECWVRTGPDKEFSKVVTHSGPNIDAAATKNIAYVKWGLYRPDAEVSTDVTTPRIVYHDDILIADF